MPAHTQLVSHTKVVCASTIRESKRRRDGVSTTSFMSAPSRAVPVKLLADVADDCRLCGGLAASAVPEPSCTDASLGMVAKDGSTEVEAARMRVSHPARWRLSRGY
jgi:hypothetical protein